MFNRVKKFNIHLSRNFTKIKHKKFSKFYQNNKGINDNLPF
ncbi:protein of unknown function [Candidatus Nitrosocosmicus franklandus]|uniref:Uncharacterized protein n=1 Tax=Candidatus Nitrosocosmicus franklandianus TaxID=1798806 RepID=A0A484I9E5_9ARCH|nr:protein of unknown function [Candidatus Nitrosocosmicus franklandus]